MNPQNVGFRNYFLALTDGNFLHSVLNNFAFSTAAIIASVTLGYLLSVFLSFKFRGVGLFKTLFFIPSLLPMSLIAVVFAGMLEYNFGTLNTILRTVGLEFLAQRWLSDPTLAYICVMSVSFYIIGIPMIFYTSELTTINTSITEAAAIDGAGMKEMLTMILFPLLKNSHKTVILSTLLGSLREFERVFLMTQGGPAGATEISGTYIYGFATSGGKSVGYVSAVSIVVLAIALIISFVQLRLYRKQ